MSREPDPAGVREALVAFAGTPIVRPGRREPAVLFRGMREVLQIAGGRESEDARIRDAASTFLRKALFFDTADHYALLGLSRTASTAGIKEHYRLLMRIVHPDFSHQGGWPVDAAARLNQAYHVLGDPERRERYDAQTAAEPTGAAPVAPRAAPPARTRRQASPTPPNKVLQGLAAAFGTAGLAGLGLLYWAGGSDSQQTLVQRAESNAGAAVDHAPDARNSAEASAADRVHESTERSIHVASGASTPDSAPEPLDARADSGTVPSTSAAAAAHPAADHLAAAAAATSGIRNVQTIDGRPPTPGAIAAASPEGLTCIARGLDRAIARVSTSTTTRDGPQSALPGRVLPVADATAGVEALSAPPPAEPATRADAIALAAAPASAMAPVAPVAPVAKAAAVPGPRLADVQPQLSRLLQHLERGTPERIAAETDPETGASTGAESFTREYARVVGLGRPVHVMGVQLQSKPGEGSLVVLGNVSLQFLDPQQGTTEWRLPLWTEFRLRHGAAVMTSIRMAGP